MNKEMDDLRREFLTVYDFKNNNVVSDKQRDILRKQLHTFYGNLCEEEALKMLLKTNTLDLCIPPSLNTKAWEFYQFCQEKKFRGFSFNEIKISDKGKKFL